MDSINITNARQDLFKLAAQTIATSRPIRITSKNGDVVMLSAEDWNALEETLFLNSNAELRDSILEGRKTPASDCAGLEDIGWDIK